ncbi:MAG TPA: adenylate/guanylate cyclase domain-containing protein, partial [Polyangiales bacterium]
MPVIVIERAGSEPRTFELAHGPNLIGRAPDNAVVVAHESLSRRHACLFIERDGVRLTDLNSKNGTFVDDARIREARLEDGSSFRCGDVSFSYREQSAPHAAPLLEIDLARRRPMIDDFWPRGADSRTPPSQPSSTPASPSRGERGRSLLHVLEALAALGDEDVFERALDLLFRILPIDHAVIALSEPGSPELPLRAARSRPGAGACSHSQHVIDYVTEHGTAVLFANAAQDPRLLGVQSIAEENICASLCVPLFLRDQRRGVLYVDRRSAGSTFDGDDLDVLCVFAGYAAISIDNVLLAKKLEEEAVLRSHLLRFFPTNTALQIMASGRASLGPVKSQVTALFCDLSGFTMLSSTLDPTRVIQLLNEYFQMLSNIVFRLGGTLEKYIGDALLAVWGAPFSSPDDAVRAVRAAIEMQRAFVELEREWRRAGTLALGIHIGLDTGLVAAGNIGSDRYLQYATIGEATTLASRICSAAQSGEILISGAMRSALGGAECSLTALP